MCGVSQNGLASTALCPYKKCEDDVTCGGRIEDSAVYKSGCKDRGKGNTCVAYFHTENVVNYDEKGSRMTYAPTDRPTQWPTRVPTDSKIASFPIHPT